jgi:hypothetical protein
MGSHNIVVVVNCIIRCLMTCVLFLRYISGYSFYAMTDLLSLWAFSNIIQFSCKNLANQISQNSRLNWIILENARSVCLFFKQAFFFTNNAANRSTSELRGSCTGFLLQDPILIPEVVSFREGSSILG